MAKPKTPPETQFSPDWKSVGIGIFIGVVFISLVVAAGGRLTEVDIFGAKVEFPESDDNTFSPIGRKHHEHSR